MKTLVVFSALFLFAALACVGCSNSNGTVNAEGQNQPSLETLLKEAHLERAEIEVRYVGEIPDSLRERAAKLIADIVAGASSHLSTSDYEDPEDLVEAAGAQAFRLYAVTERHVYLTFVPEGKNENYRRSALYEDLIPSQKKVFDFLNK